MPAATPLAPWLPASLEAASARLREASIDPAAVPHAGAETLDGFREEIGELLALGLEGEALLTVLAGPTVADPPALAAYLERLPRCATTS